VQSQPITVQVVESETQDNPNKPAPVFIDASLDQTSVYVQAQAILTLRIYHSVSLYDDSSLTRCRFPMRASSSWANRAPTRKTSTACATA
jgi:hypothetical protein